jgi:hypothetical protein
MLSGLIFEWDEHLEFEQAGMGRIDWIGPSPWRGNTILSVEKSQAIMRLGNRRSRS